ncbi:3-methyl-2-oxobutanoate hydroxymethyltransferase [Catenaria anguillulae PL171]|uniref:3-methyl-2-oxobutanoate hydroxymethyltransferase n=1 Tax=Catenaria anguillulae PL171 TaxID=765915 RepID=A0A1Y2HNS8_9FUNG|nr:3-methyl-2-oxobutanoate hydroxymethyltransferase [Catenaria anguillulae PL171]
MSAATHLGHRAHSSILARGFATALARHVSRPMVAQSIVYRQQQWRWMSARPADDAASHHQHTRKKVTLQTLAAMHRRKEPITMITAHDYPSAMFVDRAGADTLLVGDSLAMVALGLPSTVSVTMDEMLHHCRAVARGAKHPFLVADMPFGSYEADPKLAVANAARFIKEANMEAVKLEGGMDMADTVRSIVKAGIPVLGHIGLTPQRLAMLGGFRCKASLQARCAKLLVDDALALQDAGCFAVVLEAVPAPVATAITERLSIPTIGIGAGAGCSGQVLVQQDMLGIFDRFVPKFCKQYANVSQVSLAALREYCQEVKSGAFPATEHTYPMPADEEAKFQALVSDSATGKKDD